MNDDGVTLSLAGGHGEFVLLVDDGVAAWPQWTAWCTEVGTLVAAHEATYGPTSRPWEVVVRLAADATVRELNRTFRHKDKATNVLSFPNDDDGLEPRWTVGDLVLAHGVVEAEAATMGIALADHVRHLVLHGLLHLAGYDHETDADAHVMESLETRLLAMLHIADPYQGDSA